MDTDTIQNDIKKNESKIERGYNKNDFRVWLRSLNDDQTNGEKLEDFLEQNMDEIMWTYYNR